jgi:TatD DNase family protein
MYIDSHCHLNHEKISGAGSVDAIVKGAAEAGVEGMLTICCRIATEFPEVLKIAQSHDNVWCTIGTHPHDADLPDEKSISLERLILLANSDKKIIGIGESGLDYYYDNSPRDDQAESFRKHIRACIATKLPLVVHARDADDDIIKIVNEENDGTLTGVMHCFSSGRGLAEAALEWGFYVSFSGIVTFKKSTELQSIAKDVPLDRILIETDAPYLAPEPHRGKTNVPAYVGHTNAFLADLKGSDPQKMAEITKANFFRLFNKAS